MRKILIASLTASLLVACAGKSSNSSQENTATTSQQGSPSSSPSQSTATTSHQGGYAYTLTEDVALRVLSILDKKAVVDANLNPLPDVDVAGFVKELRPVRTPDEYDSVVDNWYYPTGDVYFGFQIYCLKRTDGKFFVLHNCVSTLDANTSTITTNYYILDGETLTPTTLPSDIKAADLVDELDEWAASFFECDGNLGDTKLLGCDISKKEDIRRLKFFVPPFLGGKNYIWNGTGFDASDEMVERNYFLTDDGTFLDIVPGDKMPELPTFRSGKYKTVREEGKVKILRQGEPIVVISLDMSAMVTTITLPTNDFGDAGIELLPNEAYAEEDNEMESDVR